jgi:hypothetical protein
MTEQKPATPRQMIFAAAIAAGFGGYFILVGVRLLPIPGGHANLHAPLWLVLCAGLAFFLAGVGIATQVLGHADADAEMPADAPRWLRMVQYLVGLTIFCCFGAIAGWVAFGPGTRHFSGTLIFGSAATKEMIGRVAFGVGAVLIWLATIAVGVTGLRKIFRPNTSPSHDPGTVTAIWRGEIISRAPPADARTKP